jgi:hypothetical protein
MRAFETAVSAVSEPEKNADMNKRTTTAAVMSHGAADMVMV